MNCVKCFMCLFTRALLFTGHLSCLLSVCTVADLGIVSLMCSFPMVSRALTIVAVVCGGL